MMFRNAAQKLPLKFLMDGWIGMVYMYAHNALSRSDMTFHTQNSFEDFLFYHVGR